jgi:hypothetical protein
LAAGPAQIAAAAMAISASRIGVPCRVGILYSCRPATLVILAQLNVSKGNRAYAKGGREIAQLLRT